MTHWTMQQVEENKYVYTYEGTRNTILCSIDRYDEFSRLASELHCLLHYKVVAAPFCSPNKVYIADNEGFVNIYEVASE
jgi:hypothetical protein